MSNVVPLCSSLSPAVRAQAALWLMARISEKERELLRLRMTLAQVTTRKKEN
jgi:hypothetical protein